MSDAPPWEFITGNADETRAFGARLGAVLQAGDVVLLHGDLGSGKTTLTQGIAKGLGIAGEIQSPTFTLVGEHAGHIAGGPQLVLYHLDLYRLVGADELESFGFDDYLAPPDGVSVIEWPERAGDWLPDAYLLVRLDHLGDDTRRLTLIAVPAVGRFAGVLEEVRDRTDQQADPRS